MCLRPYVRKPVAGVCVRASLLLKFITGIYN
jgi:hypothetical protein